METWQCWQLQQNGEVEKRTLTASKQTLKRKFVLRMIYRRPSQCLPFPEDPPPCTAKFTGTWKLHPFWLTDSPWRILATRHMFKHLSKPLGHNLKSTPSTNAKGDKWVVCWCSEVAARVETHLSTTWISGGAWLGRFNVCLQAHDTDLTGCLTNP